MVVKHVNTRTLLAIVGALAAPCLAACVSGGSAFGNVAGGSGSSAAEGGSGAGTQNGSGGRAASADGGAGRAGGGNGGSSGGGPLDGGSDVVATPSLSMTLSPRSAMMARDGNDSVQVRVVRHGWDGPVTVSMLDTPRGVSATSVRLPPGSDAASIRVSADDTAALGSVAATVHAAGGGLEAKASLGIQIVHDVVDPAFGNNGLVVQDLGHTAPSDMAIQSDGKILVATTVVGESGTGQRAAVYRFDVSGSLDASFADSGKAVFSEPSGFDTFPERFAVAPDDTFLLVLDVQRPDHDRIGVVRFLKDGKLDTSFGTGGIVEQSFPGFDTTDASDIALRPTGGALVTASTWLLADAASARAGLAAFLPAGQLDPGFGTGGLETQGWGHTTAAAGGRIVVDPVGTFVTGTTQDALTLDYRGVIAKLLPDGSLDQSFGKQGLFSYAHPLSRIEPTQAGVLFSVSNGLALGRITLGGTLDTSFGTNGFRSLPDLQNNDRFMGDIDFVVDPHGRLLWAESDTTSPALQILGFDGSGQPDTSFGSGGRIRLSTPEMPYVRRMLVAPDGTVVTLCALHASSAIALAKFFP